MATTLPPVRSEAEVLLRPAEEVFNRAVTLSVVATVAVAVLNGEPVDFDSLRAGSRRTFDNLTPIERSFLDAAETAQKAQEAQGARAYSQELRDDAYQLAWAYTAAEFLAWVVGLIDIDVFGLAPV
ncbi:DUF4272 domain-containing protein, partial [Kytococcus schroeteri]|uniref:DUF4272 domain-containing protein n=1 Tax=Kytococcus schroeteri TaxID=138300 RepID=UPI001EDF007D